MKIEKIALRKTNQKELLIFLMVAFGLTFFMGIPLAILSISDLDTFSFAAAQMYYPGAGYILSNMICDKDKSLMPKTFFTGFLFLTFIMNIWCFALFILPDYIVVKGSNYLVIVGTIIVGILFLRENDEKRIAYKIDGKNWENAILLLVLFLVLFIARTLLFHLVTGNLAELLGSFSISYLSMIFVGLPLSFLLNFSLFFGEEYGWRCYFQPLLQQKFGLMKGVLVFGLLWEFWHLPLVLFYYVPMEASTTLAQFILMHLINTMTTAIFMAYSYIRTNNLWLPILIHCVNNSLSDFGTITQKYTWVMVGYWILIQMVLFLPFLFSKVFRKQKEDSGRATKGEPALTGEEDK